MMLQAEGELEADVEESEELCGACEGGNVIVKNCPELPSKLEVERRFASNHVPYRDWCKMCVMGRATNSPHKKVNREEDDAVPTVSMDYTYLIEDEDENSNPILGTVCHSTGYLSAHVLPQKGDHPYAVKRMAQNLNNLGHKRMNLKSDQESA